MTVVSVGSTSHLYFFASLRDTSDTSLAVSSRARTLEYICLNVRNVQLSALCNGRAKAVLTGSSVLEASVLLPGGARFGQSLLICPRPPHP